MTLKRGGNSLKLIYTPETTYSFSFYKSNSCKSKVGSKDNRIDKIV